MVFTMAEPDDNTLTPQQMRVWLQQEIRDLTKAFELRVKDATDFATAYAVGRLTPGEAMARLERYEYRWGDSPVPGVVVQEGMSNEQIVRRLDTKLAPEVRATIKEAMRRSSKHGHSR
jgi:hypothetical protein